MSTLCSVLVGNGMYPIRFANQMNRNSVPISVNQRLAMRVSMLPSVMFFFISW